MLNGYIITSFLIALAFVLLGLVAFSRNSKSLLHKYFFIFSFSLAVWLVANYLAGDVNVQKSIALTANKLVFVFGGLGILALLFFIKALTRRAFTKPEKVVSWVSSFALAASATPFVVKDIYPENGIYAIEFGAVSNLYFLMLPILVIMSLRNLLVARKHVNAIQRSQVDVILSSFAIGLIAILFTNALLPFAFGYFGLAQVGSFFSVFFVGGLAYAIIKHKLFDIRLIVARSFGYLLSWSVLTVAYLFVLIHAASYLFGTRIEVTAELFIYVFIGLALVTGLLPLKRYFDKLTNSIFYRDAYDAQALLDKLNRILVANVDLDSLLTQSSAAVEEDIKSQYCFFGIKETAYMPQRLIGDVKGKFDEEAIAAVREMTPFIHQRVLVVDELADDYPKLYELLQSNDIAILARLTTALTANAEGVGYLVLGPKKSGNPYNNQDIKVINIIANEMVIAVQNALRFEEIEMFNITLQEKVDTATRQLRRTNEKLKALDETKDEFISMASHQLRTPLTSVKGYISMVLEGDAGALNETQRKFLDQAFVSSQRMAYLIADLLNVSRLKTGKFVIDATPTNLAEVIEGEINQLTETAAARGLKLIYEKPKDFPLLMLDETKIRQVIMNFVDNAIYYTPSGGSVTVNLEDKKDSIEFTVKDTGIGVPKSEQHHLFNKFYRAGNAKKARPDGTGLGLFMAKKVVIAQGGAIVFHTEEGKGSTFGFTFGKSKLAPPATSTGT